MKLLNKIFILLGAIFYLWLRPGAWPWLLLLLAILGAALFSVLKQPHIKVIRCFSGQRALVGSNIVVHLELHLFSVWPVWLSLEEGMPLNLIPDARTGVSVFLWGQKKLPLSYNLKANKRGAYVWPGMAFHFSDAFGLFEQSGFLEPQVSAEILIYPSAHALALPTLLRTIFTDGPITPKFGSQDPSTFAGSRNYAPGDAMRRIHWRQTARFGTHSSGVYRQLMVRVPEHVAATALLVHLNLNATGRMGEIFVESAVRLAASLLQLAAEQNLRVGVSTNTHAANLASGTHGLAMALETLALLKADPNATPKIELPPSSTNLVMISMDAPTALIEAAIKARARASQVFLLVLPEGFYLEPGESARPLFAGLPTSVRELVARANVLSGLGIRTFVLRGNDSILELGI